MINAAVMSSARQSWNTPECVLERVRRVDAVGLDPCSNPSSIVGAKVEWSLENGDNGLIMPWGEYGLVFVNPEYGRGIGKWMALCAIEAVNHTEIIALVPARTDARWFNYAWSADAICFWTGRLRFLGAPSSAPFPSAVVYWGPRKYRFAAAFDSAGNVVLP